MGVTFADVAFEVRTVSSMSVTAMEFHVLDTLEAYEDGRRVFVRSAARAFPRDHL